MRIWVCLLIFCLTLAGANAETSRRNAGTAGTNATSAQNHTANAPAVADESLPQHAWAASLGGMAAGLGLVWLAQSMGLSEAFGQVLMGLLLLAAVLAVGGLLWRVRRNGQDSSGRSGLTLQGAGLPRGYSPANVGNDASARPWENSQLIIEPARAGSGAPAAGPRGSADRSVPSGFDSAAFLGTAKANFVTLQDAWDRSDIPVLRSMMTDQMLDEIRGQLTERETLRGSTPNKTEVMVLDAQLLGIEELEQAYLASVEFSGMIREEASAGPNAFREVWNMSKPKGGSGGWLVAGVQALQ